MNARLLEQPGAIFEACAERGGTFLEKIREQITLPGERKKLRRWGIQEAAKMIGRSATTIRQAEASDPRFSVDAIGPSERDENGNRSFSLERINLYRDLFGTRKRRPPGSSAIRCAVTNFKGGAGKTTTAVHLAQKCALEGYRVLMVDLDPQATTTLLFGLIPDIHVEREETIGDVLIDNPGMLGSVIRPSYFEGIDLIAANLSLQDAEIALANPLANRQRDSGLNSGQRLDVALSSVEEQYDVIVMDCGPNLGMLTLNAVFAANGLLVPMPPAMADFGSAVAFCNTMSMLLSNVSTRRPIEFLRILLTRHSGTSEAKTTESMIRLAFDPFVLEPMMVQTVVIERASNDFGTIYDIEQPRGSAEAYKRALAAADAANEAMVKVFEDLWAQQALLAG